MNRISKRTDRRALISGVEILEGRKLMAAGETVQIVSGPLNHPTAEGQQREISDLKLVQVRGTGSFNLAASSPLVTAIEKAIAEGRKTVEVEFRVGSPKGPLVDEAIALHFTSIAGTGAGSKDVNKVKDVDHVEFTFTNVRNLSHNSTPIAIEPGMSPAEILGLYEEANGVDPLGGTPSKKDPHPTLKP